MSRPTDTARLQAQADGHWLVTGALVLDTVPALWAERNRLLKPGQTVLDLQGVERTDSAGVALLVSLLREARTSQTSLEFANIPAQLRSLARVSGVDDLLPESRT